MRSFVGAALGLLLLVQTGQLAVASCSDDDPDGSKVATARAAADEQCTADGRGCGNAPNHGAYVSCVAQVANQLASGDTPSLPRTCKGPVKRCAARSTCGKPGFVTCYRTSAEGVTKCRIKADAALCTAPDGGTVCVGTNGSCCDACAP